MGQDPDETIVKFKVLWQHSNKSITSLRPARKLSVSVGGLRKLAYVEEEK